MNHNFLLWILCFGVWDFKHRAWNDGDYPHCGTEI